MHVVMNRMHTWWVASSCDKHLLQFRQICSAGLSIIMVEQKTQLYTPIVRVSYCIKSTDIIHDESQMVYRVRVSLDHTNISSKKGIDRSHR